MSAPAFDAASPWDRAEQRPPSFLTDPPVRPRSWKGPLLCAAASALFFLPGLPLFALGGWGLSQSMFSATPADCMGAELGALAACGLGAGLSIAGLVSGLVAAVWAWNLRQP